MLGVLVLGPEVVPVLKVLLTRDIAVMYPPLVDQGYRVVRRAVYLPCTLRFLRIHLAQFSLAGFGHAKRRVGRHFCGAHLPCW